MYFKKAYCRLYWDTVITLFFIGNLISMSFMSIPQEKLHGF